MKRYMFVLLIACIILGFITEGYATMIIPATLESMTNSSDSIVIGQVMSQKSYWENQNIFTDVVIKVQEFVKNAAGDTATEITVKILGGKVGDVRLEMDNAPVFENGRKMLLFLKKNQATYVPFGFSYGVYTIQNDAVRGQEVVDGPYFQYTEHVDLKTRQTVPMSNELLTENSRELNVFIQSVKQIIK